MLLTDKPTLITKPWADSASVSYVRDIPIPSQISMEAGAASWTDGFPPLNFVPVEGGGVPPFGQDMNGVLKRISAALRWQEAGGGAYYDSAFSTSVGGYPNKAVLTKLDNSGFWANTVDNNTTNPDTGGAGWVTVTGVDYLTKSIAGSSNVTLTTDEAHRRTIVLTGAITANIQVTVPTGVNSWVFRNATTGAFTVTIAQATGAGVLVKQGYSAAVMTDGTNAVYADAVGATASPGDNSQLLATTAFVTAAVAAGVGSVTTLPPIAAAGGTVDAITATFSPAITLTNGLVVYVRMTGANTSTAPTFNANGLGAKVIVKGANQLLAAGDIPGGAAWAMLQYDSAFDRWYLQNPAYGVSSYGLISSSVTTVTVDTTLTSAVAGATVVLNKAAGLLTITLPLLSSMQDGQRIEFFNKSASTNGAFIVGNGTDAIRVNGGLLSPPSGVLIYVGDSFTVTRISATEWLAVSGTGQLKFSRACLNTTTGSHTGYERLPSGLIRQYGTLVSAGSVGAPQVVTYPIAFPNTVDAIYFTSHFAYTGVPTARNTDAWTDSSSVNYTLSQFEAFCSIANMYITYVAYGA